MQHDALVAAGVHKRDVFADVTSETRAATERLGRKKLLEYADEGDTVVLWRVDRLGRSLINVLNTVNTLRDRGILVRSLSDGIDPATSTGRLMLNMLATLAKAGPETRHLTEHLFARRQAGMPSHQRSRFALPRPIEMRHITETSGATTKPATIRHPQPVSGDTNQSNQRIL